MDGINCQNRYTGGSYFDRKARRLIQAKFLNKPPGEEMRG
jgi:hypothetical protein